MSTHHIETHTKTKTSSQQQHSRTGSPSSAVHPVVILQRARAAPESLSAEDVLQLQRTIGNQAVGQILAEIGRLPPTTQQAPVQRVKEYTHVVIDKYDVGIDALMEDLNENGLQTAESRGIELAEGSVRLGHHRHVFLWDSSEAGVRGRERLQESGDTILIRIRMQGLKEPKWYRKGNLKGDMGRLGGKSTNGAWAYEGNIDRKYILLPGDLENPEFNIKNWKKGDGLY